MVQYYPHTLAFGLFFSKMVNGAKRWLFTLNNYTDDDEQRIQQFVGNCEYLVYGHEVGESGTPHLQGYFVLHDRKTLSWIKRQLGDRLHLEVARGSPSQNRDYCTKEDAAFYEYGTLPGPQGKRNDWESYRDWLKEQDHRPTEKEITEAHPSIWGRYRRNAIALAHMYHPITDMVGDTPNAWQSALRDQLLEEADDRKVLFVVDPDGGQGKSWFCRWMYCKYPDQVQCIGMGKRDDMAHMIDSHKRIFLLNVPRGQMEYLSYPILEQIKDRMVSSPKYESEMKTMIHQPHMVVFSNEHPDESKMTEDRYVFFDVNGTYE